MNNFLSSVSQFLSASTFFAVMLTLVTFFIGRMIQKKWKSPLLNPILISVILIGIVLILFKIPLEDYQKGCAPLQYLLTPATICFAVSLYEQIGKLKKNLPAILCGILSGTLTSLISIFLMAKAFGLDKAITTSLLPKSITTAIGMALSEEAGGIVALTTTAIIMTGILGNMLGPVLCKIFRIKNDIARGAAFGTASHAIGTSKATEMSELSGAVSSLSLTFAGLITVILFSFFI